MNKSDANSSLLDFAETLLDDKLTLEIRMQGYSMFPTLKGGEIAYIQKCLPEDVKRGDILVFRHRGKFIAHRLMSIDKKLQTFTAKGDNNKHFDSTFHFSDLTGIVKTIKRTNGEKKINSFGMEVRKQLTITFPTITTALNNIHLQFSNRIINSKSTLKKLIKNIQLATETASRLVTFNALLSVLQGVMPFVLIVCMKALTDFLTPTATNEPTNEYQFMGLLSLTAFVYLTIGVLTEIRNLYGERLTQKVLQNIYGKVQQKHIELALSHLENPKSLDKIHRAVQESSYRPIKFINEIFTLLKSIASSIFLAGIFLSIKWYLVVVLIIAVIPVVLIRLKFARKFHRMKDTHSTPEREMYYYNRILTGFPFAKELKLFGFATFFRSRFDKLQKRLFSEKLQLRQSEVWWNIAAQLFSVFLIFGSLAYVAYLKTTGEISIGAVVLFFFAFQRGYSVLSDLFRSMTQIMEDNSYMCDVRDFLEVTAAETSYSHPQKQFGLQKAIHVEHVSFRYETSKREALKNINLHIEAGKTVAIVGANGSGKTTFIKLLCGFYMPSQGSITFDDVDIRLLGQATIAQNMAAVFQDFALYNISALQNIALGNVHIKPNIAKVKQAASDAGIDEVLENLPQGYHTLLGNIFQGGEELSIGQWQKLALARAFYRDAPLLILDEPSSALDVHAESQIMHALQKLTTGKTSIVISHRLNSVQWADTIFMFDAGEVVEIGSHKTLMAKKGKYYELYKTTREN
ncbi:MAG: hypothetical protein AUK44_09495 [Porphyromonadaceae bacterium CG2_30_38_12]|nr:MAG: hypothetical protein AUK44_09495 [Porphyromonadaceae bacterium CG2_30_38_12]